MIRKKAKIIGIIALSLVLCSPVSKVAKALAVVTDKTAITNNQSAPWPTKFYPYSKKDGTYIYDLYEAYNPGTDLVSSDVLTKGQSGTLPSVYVASDGTNIFFRFRIDANPLAPTAGGFDTSVWQLVIAAEDINNGSSSYGKFVQRVTIGIDGKNPSDDYVYITDGAESNVYKIFKAISNGTAGQQVVPGTRVVKAEGTEPYFLDFQIPISLITDFEKNALGLSSPITGNTPVKLYFGTTRAGSISTINKDWMDGTSMNFDNLSTVTLSSISQTLPTINIDGGSTVTAITSTPTIAGDTETADGSQIAVTINGHTYNTTVTNKRWSVDVTDPLPNGSYPVTAKVTTSLGNSATANQTLTIAKLNTAPTATNGSLTVIEDTPKIGAMLGNDVDAGTTLSYIIVSGPSHGTVSLGSNGSYTYTPASNYNGTDSFTFKVNDGTVDSNVATININTTPVNDKPLANGQSLNTNEDTTLNGTVTGSDVDGDTLSYYVVTGPAHGTLTINEDGTFTYKPNKDYNGTDSFTFKSNDGQLDSLPATVNLTVKPINDAPTSNGQTLNTNEDKSLTGTLTGADIDGDTLKYYVVSGTSHGTLNINLDGTFTYTPNKDFNGQDSFTFKVNDGTVDSASATVIINVSPVNDAPVAYGQSLNVDEDNFLNGTLTGFDIDGDMLSYYLVTGPTHGTLTINEDGTFTYTPNKDYNGQDSFTFKTYDGSEYSTPALVNITVKPVNDQPVANGKTLSTDEDKTLLGTLTGTDVDGDSLKYYVVTQPTHGILILNQDGTFTYTPNKDYNGEDSFTFKVNDGTLDSALATVNLTVNPVNDKPIADGQTLNTDEDKALTGTLTGSDIDGDSLKYYVVTAPLHGTLIINQDGTFTYTPDKDYNGEDSFTFKVNDGAVDSTPATVNLAVNQVNDAPIAIGQTLSTDEDKILIGTLTGSDIDGDSLKYYVVAGPLHGTLVINQDGTFTYTPNKDYNGEDSFTFKVNDGDVNSASATVNLTVNPVNDKPIANGQTLSTDEDKTLTGTLTGSDVDGDSLKYYVVTAPKHGILVINQDGTFTYTPNKDYNGEDTFTFKVNDGDVDSAAATVNLTVNPVNDKPTVLESYKKSTLYNQPVGGTITGNDIDEDILSYYVTENNEPSNGKVSIDEITGEWTYTPNEGFSGEDSFKVTVSDGKGGTTETIVYITVAPKIFVNTAPTANKDTFSVDEDKSLVGVVKGSDIDEDNLTYYLVTAPTHGTLIFNEDGTFSYTPNKDYNGEDGFTFKVNDGYVDSAPATVNLTVNPVNDKPTANGQTLSTDEDKALTGTLTGSDIDGDSLKYYVVTAPKHGILVINQDGTFTYTPNKDYNGEDSFTFKVNDGTVDSAPATVNLTVNPVNDTPIANGQTLSTDEDKALTGTLTGSDNDGDSLKYYLVTAPLHGTVVIKQDGTFSYTPNKDYNGEDSFTFKTNDGSQDSAPATVHITVKPVNDGPTSVESYNKTTPYNKAVSGTVVGSDIDKDELNYSVAQINKPIHGIVSINPITGEWTYTPNKGFSGNDSFKVSVSDGKGGTAVSTVYIKVLNADPTVENYSRSTTINKAVSDSVVGIDENGDNLTYSIVSSPNSGTVSLDHNSGRWIYTPKTGFSGLDSFKIEVNDGNGGVALSNISINVSATLNLIGNITDQVTGNILSDSTVELRDSSNTLIATVNTNSNGNYYFKNIKLGNYILIVKNSKYSTQTLALKVATDGTNTDEIRKDAKLVNFVVSLVANPKVIKGDGVQTTTLTTKVTDKNNNPLANTIVTFSASMGSFPNGSVVKTDENGIATIVYKSAKIEGIENVSIPVIATVEDKSRGLYTSDKITITFEPGMLTGVVVDNTTHLPVKGAVIEISKDFNNDGIVDFYSKMITGVDGIYKIAIPKGGITYDVKITKPVVIGGETKLVTFNQKSTVDDIKGDGGEVFASDKTAAGMVLFKKPNGQDTLLKDYSNLSFDVYDKDNNLVTAGINTHIYNSANDKGVFSADGLEKGEQYKFAVKYTLPNGQKIIIGTMNVAMSQDGEINLSSALIDPYGTITDSITHKIITNVNVKLYYANTARNILAGRKPGTLVELPLVSEFPPADNANPQSSDDFGKYAYMVFPDADYIVVAAKDGYETYTSPIISVGKEIVKHDFSMNEKAKQAAIIAQLPKTGSVVDMNGLIMLGTILMLSGVGLTLRPKKN